MSLSNIMRTIFLINVNPHGGRFRTFVVSNLGLLVLFVFAITSVYAESAAVNEILRSPALEGDGHYRTLIAYYLDKPVSFIITVVGWLIITLTVVKFVLTFLYLTFPNFFDKLDNYAKTSLSVDLKSTKNPIDFISYILSLFIPNVKSLTDYANGEGDMDVSPAGYLKRRGPFVLGMIILGAMIFDGDTKEFMAKGAEVGLFISERIQGHDTVGAVGQFLARGDHYNYSYDTRTLEGKNKMAIAKEIDKALRGMNNRITSTTYFTEVGVATTSMVDETVRALFENNGYPIDQVKAMNFNAKVLAITVESDNNPTRHVIPIPEDLKRNNQNANYLHLTLTNVRIDEDAGGTSLTGGGSGRYFPGQGAWNFNSGSGVFTITLPEGNKVSTEGSRTLSGATMVATVMEMQDEKPMERKAEVRVTARANSNVITVNVRNAPYTDNRSSTVDVGRVAGLKIDLSGEIKINSEGAEEKLKSLIFRYNMR